MVVVSVGALVLGLVLLAGTTVAATFTDVYSNTYDNPDYPEAVSALSDIGIISGMPDGTFHPHDPVTRQQFAKLIVLILGLPVTGNEVCPFVDVELGTSPKDPFYPDKYVAVCAANGVTQGTSATTFAPHNGITRAQLLSMVVRAARKAGVALLDPGSSYFDGTGRGSHFFADWDDPNHAYNAQTAEVNGLLYGIWPAADNTWNPYAKATRGEVAQILYRLYQKMGSTDTTSTTHQPGTSTTAPTTGLLESDDFSDPGSGWENDQAWSDGQYQRYENGTYVVELDPERSYTYTFDDLEVANVRVEADITLVTSDLGGIAGLVLHHQDGMNCYVLLVTPDGYYSVQRAMEGSWDYLTASWTYSPAIKTTGQVNHVEFKAVGNQFSGYVNGTLLCTVTSNYVPTGSAGFIVGALGTQPVKVIIDNMRVWSE